MLCLGIDSGTTSCKALVLDPEKGRVLAQARAPHSFVADLPAGAIEQDPAVWLAAAEKAITDCLAQIAGQEKEIAAIGVSAQQHGLVALGEENEPVRPAKLWCDISTAAQAEELNRAFGSSEQMVRRTGNAQVPGYTASKILWLKQEEPENFEHARTFFLPHDYLNFWLTGERRMEFGDASGTGLLDVPARTWYEPLAELIDADLLAKFPPLRSSKQPAGLLRTSLGEKWKIGDAVVSAGSGDNMMGAIGTGNVSPGRWTLSLGTSGTLYAFAETPVIDPRGEISAFCDATDHWLPLACTMNVASAVEQMQALFGFDLKTLEQEVALSSPGAAGLIFLPYLQGERFPNLPRGRGVLHGLNLQNMNRGDIARALIEGIVIGLAAGGKRLRELGLEASEIRLTGGGGESPVIRQIIADIFQLPVIGMRIAEGAALGAAIHAGATFWRTKGSPPTLKELSENNARVETKTRAEPRPEFATLYTEQRGRHADLTRKLATGGYL